VVYRVGGRQRKQSADTLAEARASKLERDGEARAKRRGPTATRHRDCLPPRPLAPRPFVAGSPQVVLPRRRAGRAWSTRERRFLTRTELVRLLDEVPAKWRPLFELLAATGLRLSEAIGLRWSDLVLDEPATAFAGAPRDRQRRNGGPPVSPRRTADPADARLAATLRAHQPRNAVDDAFVFPGRDGGASDQGSPRRRALIPAAERAGLTGVGFTPSVIRARKC
jgi:integrase